jgi:hypothetical protein
MLFRAFFAAAVVFCATASAEQPKDKDAIVSIPSKDIWGYSMMATKNVRELEPDFFSPGERKQRADKSLTEQIEAHCSTPNDEGFAVVGTGKEALKNIYSVVGDKEKPKTTFPSGTELSLFFYSKVYGSYVRVDHAEVQDKTVEIFYRYVPHNDRDLTWHYAIIPVGRLSPGTYNVKITQLPVDMSLMHGESDEIDTKAGDKYVCKPFSFSVSQ